VICYWLEVNGRKHHKRAGGYQMNVAKLNSTFLPWAAAMMLVVGSLFTGAAQPASRAPDSSQAKIARAMSAGPADIAKAARIVDTDARGKMVVLRAGTNGFTCMPGNPKVVGEPPMCADAVSMQWFADGKAHRLKPTTTVPGVTYMLAGATQRSDSDPNDTTSPPH
jgi:hypothetical protein